MEAGLDQRGAGAMVRKALHQPASRWIVTAQPHGPQGGSGPSVSRTGGSPSVVRFAHPLRRNTDTTARLARTAQAGAVGLSVVTLVGWMWQMRRRRVS